MDMCDMKTCNRDDTEPYCIELQNQDGSKYKKRIFLCRDCHTRLTSTLRDAGANIVTVDPSAN